MCCHPCPLHKRTLTFTPKSLPLRLIRNPLMNVPSPLTLPRTQEVAPPTP